jgi:MscS family membrane protein
VFLIVCAAWFAARFSREFFVEYTQRNTKLDKTVIYALQRALVVLIWLVAAISTLQTLGINLGALIATLGIGTAAVALAAQDILKNIIAGITLFIDRPFRIGEYIKTKEVEGYVRRIGLRSTSMETFDKRLITLPNHKMTDMAIENVSGEPSRRVVLKLGLVYQTTPPKMQEALDILTSLPKTVQCLAPDTVATFSGYGDFALEVTFIYYIKKKYEGEVLQVTSKVNFAIFKLFADAGLNFAYPTQTVIVDK